MKPFLPLFAWAAAIAAAVLFVPQSSPAQQPSAASGLKVPVGQRCIVTLDPAYPAKIRQGGTIGDTYKIVDNTLQGDLVEITADWLILRDGNYENWIPRDKVLSMRVSR